MASLSVKYRPDNFKDVIGQFASVNILQRQITEKTFKNTYLFYGDSGTGKTTCARIFADSINSGTQSYIEIDAASNNGVDNIKSIIKSAYERSVSYKYKIYIIDECHMLTIQAFNSLLKCIEEPPKYTIFILCTTELNKVPQTIRNRCQVFTFNKVSVNDITNRLKFVCEQEGFTNYDESVKYIARISNGSPRQALTFLDKVSSGYPQLDIERTIQILGNFSFDVFYNLTKSLINRNDGDLLYNISTILNSGNDIKVFVDEYINYLLGVLKYIIFSDMSITGIPISCENQLVELTKIDSADKYYMWVCDRILGIKNMIKNTSSMDTIFQVEMLKICRCI